MTTYYVKTAGDDTDSGLDWANAWATSQYAFDTATAGDTVIWDDDTWTVAADDVDTNNGASGNEITFQANTRQGTTLVYTGGGLDIDGVDYVTFDGFIFDGDGAQDGSQMIRIEDQGAATCTHITFQHCKFQNTIGHAVRALTGTISDLAFYNCTFYPQSAAGDGSRDGINITGTAGTHIDTVTIRNCTIEEVDHVGINLRFADNVEIEDCEIWSCEAHGIGIRDDCDTVTIHHCTIYDGGDGNYNMGNCIYIEDDGQQTITIRHNVLRDADQAGLYIRDDPTGPIYVWNNVFHNLCNSDQTYGAFRTYDTANPATDYVLEFKNNIIYSEGEYLIVVAQGNDDYTGNFDFDYNCYYDSSGDEDFTWLANSYGTIAAYIAAAVSDESHSVDDNPDLTDVANDIFLLSSVSPCIDTGTDVGLGYYGTAPDMGAYELYPNLVAIQDNGTSRVLFCKNGEAYADVEWTLFDEHDDLALLETLERRLTEA